MDFARVFLVCLTIQVSYSHVISLKKNRSPIILVPGAASSQLEARLDRKTVMVNFCPKKTQNWFNVWMNLNDLLTHNRYCLADNVRLQWDPTFKKMNNVPGVFTRCPHFGDTTSVEWLDPTSKTYGAYFYPLVQTLCNAYGYVRGKTIRGAPYDFRYDPGSTTISKYFAELTKLVESMFKENGKEKVVLLAHSMGAPYMLHFLRGRSQQWKDKYIKSLVTLGGSYGGAVKSVKTYISGETFHIPKKYDIRTSVRALERTFSSLAYSLPDKNIWDKDEVLVKVGNKTYTVKDYDELFKDMGYPLASDILKSIPAAWNPASPGVKIYCFYGINVPTMKNLAYSQGDFPDNLPAGNSGNGDGTVNIQSLQACKKLPGVSFKEFDGVDHDQILNSKEVFKELHNIL